MLNPYDHEDGEALAEQVRDRLDPLRGLVDAAIGDEADLIYVNDNYEDFTATSKDLGEHAMNGRQTLLVHG